VSKSKIIDNGSEFEFPLSIHGAWMLLRGIETYMSTTVEMYDRRQESASYSMLRIGTAINEAKKLLTWAENVPPYLGDMAFYVKEVLAEFEEIRTEFKDLPEMKEK
jgi:hypothetical protein